MLVLGAHFACGFSPLDTRAQDWQETGAATVIHAGDPSNVVWLRAYVRVPGGWTQGRSVMTETLSITLEHVTGACELFVNGTSIGMAGSFPPDYRPADDELFRFKIPPGVLVHQQYNCIALRFYADDGRVGFAGRAPVFAGYHDECILSGEWELFMGDLADADRAAALKPFAAKPARAAYDEFRPATSALRRPSELSPGRHLSPEQSLASMKTADDLAVDLVLAEPQIAQPLSLDFDERGRLWVVEYRQYPYPAGIQMVSRDKFYRAAYDKVPPAPPNHVRGADRISVHEDTDGDGTFDKHHTFMDGLNIVSSVEIAYGGVWILNPPYLLFVPDADGNAIPDGDPEVHLEGFGLEDTHSIANCLTWGPDGWLYGAQGSTTSSRIKVRGTEQPEVYRDGATVWRYHPTLRRYEIYAEGGGNAFGLEIDAAGRIFSGHNGSDTRGFHYVQGAYMQKGTGNKYGPPSNPHAYGHLMYMQHDPTPRFSHDLIKYEGVGLPEQYRGKLFCIDPLHRNVVLVELRERGATYRTEDLGTPLETDDLAFRPVDITTGPDGAIYIADFCEEFIAHGQHYQGQVNVDTGRVWRLRARDRSRHRPIAGLDCASTSAEELVDRLGSEDRWERRTAARVLEEREVQEFRERLIRILDQQPLDGLLVHSVAMRLRAELPELRGQKALEALWVVHLYDGLDDKLADKLLGHEDADVRAWTVRLLGDREFVREERPFALTPSYNTASLVDRLVELARTEQDPQVRSQLACTAKRFPIDPCLAIAAALATHDGDADDPYMPQLIWWAIESKASDREAVLDLFRSPDFWGHRLVTESLLERVMRRYASGGREDLEVCGELLELSPNEAATEGLMKGFEAAFAGRTLTAMPPRLVDALVAAGGGSLSLRVRQGDETAIHEVLAALDSADTEPATRIEYARLFGEVLQDEAVGKLLAIVESSENAELVAAALASLQAYDDERIAATVLARLPSFSDELRESGLALLASRAGWAGQLLAAIGQHKIEAALVPPDVVRRMAMHRDPAIGETLVRLWPDLDQRSSAAVADSLARATSAMENGDADLYRGHALFTQTCAKCHVLFREGGQIGPDLTSHQRDDTPRMLLAVANPSLEIREGFETWTVTTDDGRVLTGFLFDQDANVVVLRGADGQNVTVRRESIEDMSKSPASLMPEGLLDELSDQQIRDLFSYLRTSQPLDE
jgi:putative membrane-bound dehydrogenase-like protein